MHKSLLVRVIEAGRHLDRELTLCNLRRILNTDARPVPGVAGVARIAALHPSGNIASPVLE